jgi:hypothetical protein
MPTKKPGTLFSKQQLEIIKYQGDIKYGPPENNKSLDRVIAKNLSLAQDDPLYGREINHTIFKESLKEFLSSQKAGFRFIADVEETERLDKPEMGPNRTIIQVYDNGQPIAKSFKGGGFQGRNPEIIKLEYSLKAEIAQNERVSAEGRLAIEQVGKLLERKEVPEFLSLEDLKKMVVKYYRYLDKSIDALLALQPLEMKPSAQNLIGNTKQNSVEKPQNKQEPPDSAEAVSNDQKPDKPLEFQNVGQLFTAASKLKPPVTRAEILRIEKVTDPSDIKNLADAYRRAVDVIKAKAKESTKSSEEAWENIKRTPAA